MESQHRQLMCKYRDSNVWPSSHISLSLLLGHGELLYLSELLNQLTNPYSHSYCYRITKYQRFRRALEMVSSLYRDLLHQMFPGERLIFQYGLPVIYLVELYSNYQSDCFFQQFNVCVILFFVRLG